jgi:flagellin-specific chaperone FliS
MYQAYFKTQQEYRQQDVLGASPIRLVVMAYDVAIQACEQKDFERAVKAISVLRDALDFDYKEVAVGLFRVYQYCLDCLRKGDYTTPMGNLKELREAWIISEKRLNLQSQSVIPASIGRVSA